MMNDLVDFGQLQDRCTKYLNDRKYISLATAYQDRVRARVVDYVNDGLKICFLTWADTIKMDHLKKNPWVSLCIEALQVEGKVFIGGHPSLEGNAPFMELYKERHPSPFKNFISQSNTLLITIEPTLFILMKYEHRQLVLDHLDMVQMSAFRKVLSPWDPS
jgi:general stress protein 26